MYWNRYFNLKFSEEILHDTSKVVQKSVEQNTF